jgi:hypothetical protein
LRYDQSLGVSGEAHAHADNPLARLAAMPTIRLEVRAKGQPLLRDVIEMIGFGSFHFDDVAIRPLPGEREILDMDEHVSMENTATLFLVGREADKMRLSWCPSPAFDGLAKVGDFTGKIPLTLLIR